MAEKPMFVKVDEHEDIKDMINLIKSKINESKDVLGNIQKLKQEEESELQAWKAEIEDVERKVQFINSTLFE